MAQFDIYIVRGGLALDCQANLLRRMPSRFVVPIEPHDPALVINAQINPSFTIRGRAMVMVTQLAGTIRTGDLQDVVASLAMERDQRAVQRALDMLITGV